MAGRLAFDPGGYFPALLQIETRRLKVERGQHRAGTAAPPPFFLSHRKDPATALVQMVRCDQLRWHAERAEVSDGQAEERGGIVQGSPLRPRDRHPVRALVFSVQAEPAR